MFMAEVAALQSDADHWICNFIDPKVGPESVHEAQVRARMFTAEVAALQFNVLVTTYEYIMRDRSRLSKVRCWLPHAARAC